MSLSPTHVGSTLVLTIDRPPVNALDLAAVEALREAFSAIGRDPPRDGVVLTGAGDRAFKRLQAFLSPPDRPRSSAASCRPPCCGAGHCRAPWSTPRRCSTLA